MTLAPTLKMQTSSGAAASEHRRDLFLFAGVERAADDAPASRLDLGDQWRQLVTVPSPGEDGEAFGREFLGDGCADKVAGADHGGRCIFLLQNNSPRFG